MQSWDRASRPAATETCDAEAAGAIGLPGPGRPAAPFPTRSQNQHKSNLTRQRLAVLLIALSFGLGLRLYHLSEVGLAEDEVNKILAVRCYQQGQFTVNAEHPMLMKLMCLAAMTAAQKWNVVQGALPEISDETAIRFPNALFGALTVVPLFLLAEDFFGFEVAALTALLWSFGLNAIWFNRIAKEDTLLVFFMMAGFCLYNRAKNLAEEAVQGQAILYGLSGAAFGLMFSSKYFPHYYGLLMLFYFLAGTDRRNNRPVPPVARKYHYAAMMLAFVTFNFALFLPETWRYLVNYIHEDLQTHHGYLVMGRLYPNDLSYTPGGPPWYFYWLYLLVKMPVPVIVSFCIGLIEIFRKRRSERGGRGYLFLRLMLFFWLIPMSFIGAKFLRYTLALLPFVYMTAAVGIASFYKLASVVVMSLRRSESLTAPSLDGPAEDGLVVRGNPGKGVSRVLIGAALVLIFVVAPSATTLQSLPFPGLYTNAIGQSRIGYFFPHDEFYDLGARESIRYIAEHALPGSSVASEIPATLQYYLDKFGRNDLRSVIISHPGGEIGDPPDFFLVQPGRVYYENEASIVEIQSRYPVVQQSGYSGVVTTTVYQNSELGGKPRSPADNKLRASE